MAKKRGKGKSRNQELKGGKNTLPKKQNGTVDIKKVVQEGKQEQKKKWIDKKVVKDAKVSLSKIKPTSPRGISRLMTNAKGNYAIRKAPSKLPSKTAPKSKPAIKGVSKLKAKAKVSPKPRAKAPIARSK